MTVGRVLPDGIERNFVDDAVTEHEPHRAKLFDLDLEHFLSHRRPTANFERRRKLILVGWPFVAEWSLSRRDGRDRLVPRMKMAARAVERAHDRISWTPACAGAQRSAQRKPLCAAPLKTRWLPQGGAPPRPGSSSEPTGPVRSGHVRLNKGPGGRGSTGRAKLLLSQYSRFGNGSAGASPSRRMSRAGRALPPFF